MAGDLYAVLGVVPGADARAVTLAYRRLCRRYHPDLNHEPGAGARMRQINAAYEVLGDSRQRLGYDRKRAAAAPPVDAWSAAYRAWRDTARPPSAPAGSREARIRVTPGAVDFGFIGRGEIAVRPILVRRLDGRPLAARILTRGDWLSASVSQLQGRDGSLQIQADPRDLHGFWSGPGPEEARLDGWLEIVDVDGSVRVPAGAILRRDTARVARWNPFAKKVG